MRDVVSGSIGSEGQEGEVMIVRGGVVWEWT